MVKYLCWGSLGTAGLLLVLFITDLIVSIPFSRLSPTVDVWVHSPAASVGYLSWEASRELHDAVRPDAQARHTGVNPLTFVPIDS